MEHLCTRAFCRHCRLHFEYALTDTQLVDDPLVLCPRCGRPAKHDPFQPCSADRYERIEAKYEYLAEEAEAKRVKRPVKKLARKPAKSKHEDQDWVGNGDWEEDYLVDRKHRKGS